MPLVYDLVTDNPISTQLKNERRRIRDEQIRTLQSLEDKLAVFVLDLDEPPSCVKRVAEMTMKIFKVAQVMHL